MFKKILVFFISLSLAYSPIALAQSQSMVPVGWTKSIGPSGFVTFSAPPNTGSGAKLAANMIWEAAVPSRNAGGAVFAATTKLAVGASEVAVITKGAVTAASVFSAVKLVAMGGTGVVGLGLTALTMAPMIADYFTTDKSKLGPLSSRESDKPFLLGKEKPSVITEFTTEPIGNTGWFPSRDAACSAYVEYLKNQNPGTQFQSSSTSPICQTQKRYSSDQPFSDYYGRSYATREASSFSIEWVPASMDDIKPYMDAPEKAIYPDQIQEILKFTPLPIVYPAENGTYFPSGVLSVTGPTSVPGTPSVSTTETPEKITTTTKTPQTDLKYGSANDPLTNKPVPTVTAQPGEKIVVTETDKATGITKVISTTTTETPIAPVPTTPTEIPDLCALHPEIVACATVDQVDMCKVYPDSLACQKIDEPEVPDLEELEKPITFTPDSGWGGAGGSCPAPRHLSSGTGADFVFTPYCDFMTALRPVFVSVAWLSGAMILIGANRKE